MRQPESRPISALAVMLSLTLTLMLTSCLFQPNNETALGGIGERVTFRWVSIGRRSSPVDIEAATSAAGPFAVIDTVTPVGSPVSINGANLTEFEATVVIPDVYWTQTCAGSETFVRARGGALIFTSYDDASITGETPEQCITNDGGFFPFSAIACASDFAPPLRLTAPGPGAVQLAGDLEIVSPYQADDYACLESVDGNFVVSDPSLEDLSFPLLASVTGDVELHYGYGNASIRTIDLPLLHTVGGSLLLSIIDEDPTPFPNFAAPFGLPALTFVGNDLRIVTEGPGVTQVSVSGLPLLTTIFGNLEIDANNGDNGYSGLLPALEQVDGHIVADLGFSVSSGFDAISTVGGDVEISVNSWLGGNGGFDGLVSVGGDFRFFGGSIVYADDFPALQNVGGDLTIETFGSWNGMPGERYLPQLTMVAGDLRWVSTSAIDLLSQLGSTTVLVGGLTLDGNLGLSDLPGRLSQVQIDTSGSIMILDNDGISDCDAQDYVDGLPGHVGPVSISGNDPC